jgi:hypothetical protein
VRPQTLASVQMLRNNIRNVCGVRWPNLDIAKLNAYMLSNSSRGWPHLARHHTTALNIIRFRHMICATNQVYHVFLMKIKVEHGTEERSYSYNQPDHEQVPPVIVQKGEECRILENKGCQLTMTDYWPALETITTAMILKKD